MNLIDGYVKEVLNYEVKKSSECWKLEPGEEDKKHHIYTVRYVDMGGESTTQLWLDKKNDDVKEGYRFAH